MPQADEQHADVCGQCLRPKCTAADLERWRDELPHDRAPEPEWARWICWTKPGVRCACRVFN